MRLEPGTGAGLWLGLGIKRRVVKVRVIDQGKKWLDKEEQRMYRPGRTRTINC